MSAKKGNKNQKLVFETTVNAQFEKAKTALEEAGIPCAVSDGYVRQKGILGVKYEGLIHVNEELYEAAIFLLNVTFQSPKKEKKIKDWRPIAEIESRPEAIKAKQFLTAAKIPHFVSPAQSKTKIPGSGENTFTLYVPEDYFKPAHVLLFNVPPPKSQLNISPQQETLDLDLTPIVRYFKDCYEADNREMSLNNFFSSKVEHHHFFEGEDDWLNGYLPQKPVPEEWADKVEKELALYPREKELMVGALFVIGESLGVSGKPSKLCSPLLLYPTEIIREDEENNAYLKVDLSKGRLNYPLLQKLARETGANLSNHETSIRRLPHGQLDFAVIGKLARALKKILPGVDAEGLLMYPQWEPKAKLKQRIQPARLSKLKAPYLLPAAVVGVTRRTADTEGPMGELRHLADCYQFPKSMLEFFGQPSMHNITREEILAPTLLNAAQTEVLHLPFRHRTSVIIGPPGTGKSYTLAALAADLAGQGLSVLIASRNDEAVDVVGDKISRHLKLKGLPFRAGRKEHVAEMQKRIEALAQTIHEDRKDPHTRTMARILDKLAYRKKRIKELQAEFDQITAAEIEWSRTVVKHRENPTVLKKLRRKFEAHAERNTSRHWRIMQSIQKSMDEQMNLRRKYIKLVLQMRNQQSAWYRSLTLKKYMKAVRSRTSEKQTRLFDELNWQWMMDALPVWLVKLSDLSKVLPLKPELFDVVIVDEASQCDVASVLPLLYRGKTAIFCGDPKQLRHVSFLSRARQLGFAHKHGLDVQTEYLDFRGLSALDVARDNVLEPTQQVFLDEHYRSLPPIIEFSNQHIYGSRLRVMTERPAIRHENSIVWHQLEGKRESNGTNPVELEAVIEQLQAIIEQETDLPNNQASTIGILSPFRNQTEALNKIIMKHYTLTEIKRHRIMAGTAFSFQGEERDVMLLSMVIDTSSPGAVSTHLNKEDVFNVSVTRAKRQQIVFTSVGPQDLKSTHLLRHFLEYLKDPKWREPTERAVRHAFAYDVINELAKHEVQGWEDQAIAGHTLDVVLRLNEMVIGVDLIGYPGRFEETYAMERYLMFKRAGLTAYPLPFTYWLVDTETCVTQLLALLNPKT